MKITQSIISKLFLSCLLALSIPIASIAEPQSEENEGHEFSHHFSTEGHMGHHFGNRGGEFHFPSGIDLTESQRDQIFSIKHKQEALFYEQGKIVRKAHIDLHKLVISDQYDDDKAKIITEKLGKAVGNIKFLQVQEKHQIYSLLTTEQRNYINAHRFNRFSEHSKYSTGSDGEKSPMIRHP